MCEYFIVRSALECLLYRSNKGKVHRGTGQEGPKPEEIYRFTLSLTSALDGVGGQRLAPAPVPPGKRPGTQRTGGCRRLSTGRDARGKPRPLWISIPWSPSRSSSRVNERQSYPVPAMRAQKWSRGLAPFRFNLDTKLCEWSTLCSGRFTPGKDPQYALKWRLGGPQNQSGLLLRLDELLRQVSEIRAVHP
jgi:hypothetical protein